MSLTIFSFQRAFTAKHQMALAAGNIDNIQVALEAKDILDSLHLGLICETMACDEFCNSTSIIDEFIANCENILIPLSLPNDNGPVTIHLLNQAHLTLKEENGDVTLEMDGEQLTIAGLCLGDLYQNLAKDIQSNPDLYGTSLTSYIKNNEVVEPN